MISFIANRKVLYSISSIFIGLIIAVIIGEISLRALGLGYGSAPLISDSILHHRHPPNYLFTVYDPRGEYGGHKIYYDERGLASYPLWPDLPKIKIEDASHRIAFMGDSFVEATHLPYPDSFVGRIQASSAEDVLVRNYGTSTYSPIFYLLQWETVKREFRPTHLFLLLNSGDIGDDEMYSKHALYSKEKEITAIPGPGDDWWKAKLRKSYLIRFIRRVWLQLAWLLKNHGKHSSRVVGNYVEEEPALSELSAGCVLKLAERVKNSSSKFTLMVVPSKYRLQRGEYNLPSSEFSDKWKMWAERHSLEFLDLVPPFRLASKNGTELFFNRDIHFNKRGHEVTARVIQDAYPEYFRREK